MMDPMLSRLAGRALHTPPFRGLSVEEKDRFVRDCEKAGTLAKLPEEWLRLLRQAMPFIRRMG
jgi:hypothetical protein